MKISIMLIILFFGVQVYGSEVRPTQVAKGTDSSAVYHFKKWSLLRGGATLSSSVVANFDFSNGASIPFTLTVSCMTDTGEYWIYIDTNRDDVSASSNWFGGEAKYSFIAAFDGGKNHSLSLTKNQRSAIFPGDQATVLSKIESSSLLSIRVSRVFDGGAGSDFMDEFDLSGADVAMQHIKKACKKSGR